MNPSIRIFVVLLGLAICQRATASDTVVLGRLVSNEPMSYVKDECPEDHVCSRSWWKSVVEVEKTVQGRHLSGRVTAAVMQHTSLNARFKRAVRLFALTPIDDPDQRAKLRADYYLEEMSEPQQMFCTSRDPKRLGLSVQETYVSGSGDNTTYCFGLPRSQR
jgi:hypothetical protein